MRLVSLLITLLIMAFLIIQMLGGSNSQNKAEQNTARIAEDKAMAVQATILKSAQAQDRRLNGAEGGPGGYDPSTAPGFNNLTQQIQQGQQVQGQPQQADNGQPPNP